MDFRSEASSWTIHPLAEDIIGDSAAGCAESPWEQAPDARGLESSMVALRDGRHRTPSPSIPCIDPRLTVLWPSPAHSPPASPSEESSIEGDLSAFDDCPEDSSHACAPDVLESTTLTSNVETEFDVPNASSTKSPPSGLGGGRMMRSTERRAPTPTQARAASRNSKEMVKGPDKTHTRWKCGGRTKGMVAPSGTSSSSPSSSARPSQSGRCPNPGPIDKGVRSRKVAAAAAAAAASMPAEGIEKIHVRLWKCRTGGCNKTFHRKGDAVRHLQTTARHNGKAVVCGCGAPFSRLDALKRHQRLCNRPVG